MAEENDIHFFKSLPYLIKCRLMETLPYLLKNKVAEIDPESLKLCAQLHPIKAVIIKIQKHAIIINEKTYPFSVSCISGLELMKFIDVSNSFPTRNLYIQNEDEILTKDSHDPVKCIVTDVAKHGFVIDNVKNKEKSSTLLKSKVENGINEIFIIRKFSLENINSFFEENIRLLASGRNSSITHDIVL